MQKHCLMLILTKHTIYLSRRWFSFETTQVVGPSFHYLTKLADKALLFEITGVTKIHFAELLIVLLIQTFPFFGYLCEIITFRFSCINLKSHTHKKIDWDPVDGIYEFILNQSLSLCHYFSSLLLNKSLVSQRPISLRCRFNITAQYWPCKNPNQTNVLNSLKTVWHTISWVQQHWQWW